MSKIKFIIIFIILIYSESFSQADSNKYFIKIDSIKLNTTKINHNDYLILISTKDSLSIYYSLASPQNSPKEDFYYKIILTNGFDSAIHTTGFNSLNYKALQMGKYILDISAFALKGNWKTPPLTLKIVSDDSLAKLAQQAKIEEQNLLKNQKTNTLITSQENKRAIAIPKYLIYIGILVIVVFLGIIFAFIFKNKSKTFKKNNKEGFSMEQKETIKTDEGINKIFEENKKLKAEIDELHSQMDIANIRVTQLSTQNKELESKIEALLKTKDSLEELNQQKDELFGVIIHDIKNPAAIIKNLVDLLRSYDLTANEQMEVIQDIAETSQKILDLSMEVTLVLSIESGKMALNFETNQIKDLIENVVSKNQVMAKKKNIKLFTELPDNLPEVEMDYRKISEALENLISNALKFTEEEGTVRVRAFKEGGNINIEVSDNGLGLSEEDVEKAFRWGQRLSAQPTAGEPSSGLGLWIVKKIIDSHNGRVWIKSALGKGSTFAFSFPIKRKE